MSKLQKYMGGGYFGKGLRKKNSSPSKVCSEDVGNFSFSTFSGKVNVKNLWRRKCQEHKNVCPMFGSSYGPPFSLLHLVKIIALPATDEGSQADNNQRVRDWVNARGARARPSKKCWEETLRVKPCEVWHCHATRSHLVSLPVCFEC